MTYRGRHTRRSTRTRVTLGALTLLVLATLSGAPTLGGVALADQPGNPNGWGTVVSQQATSTDPGTLGEHASSQPTPREGVGNVSRDPARNDLDDGHPGGHGCFVAGVDGNPATACNGDPGTAR